MQWLRLNIGYLVRHCNKIYYQTIALFLSVLIGIDGSNAKSPLTLWTITKAHNLSRLALGVGKTRFDTASLSMTVGVIGNKNKSAQNLEWDFFAMVR